MGCAASVHATDSQCKDPKHKYKLQDYDNTIRAVTEQSRKESEEPPQKQPEKKEIRFGPVKLLQEISRVLLVFPVEDGQSEAFLWACRKGGFACSMANSLDNAMDTLDKRKHHIVVIDMRLNVYSIGEQIVRKIRSRPSFANVVTLAVCPAIPRWCEEPSVRPYLDMGFNRCWFETSRLKTQSSQLVKTEQDFSSLNSLPSDTCTSSPELSQTDNSVPKRFLENHDRGACLNEIVMMDTGEVSTGLKLSVANTLFQLLEESRDSFDITDIDGICSYVNPAFEKLAGFKSIDMVGKSTDVLLNEEKTGTGLIETMQRCKAEGKVWEGVVVNNRTGLDPISVEMKIMPVFDAEGNNVPSHFVTCRLELNPTLCRSCLNKNQFNSTTRRMSNGRVRTESSNTSINSISVNNTSRRLSKQVDAPIIKILTMLRSIQDTSPQQLPAQLIENVMAMLRSSELYNPGSNSLTEDPEALGFMDGLMEGRGTRPSVTGDTILSHRDSCESLDCPVCHMIAHLTESTYPSESTAAINNITLSQTLPTLIKENLTRRKEWDYDVVELERLSSHRPLFYLGFDILVEFGILNLFKIEETTLRNWLGLIESNYRSCNTYHNSTHAADVLQASAYFCRSQCMENFLDPTDFLALLIASICHDIDHPGRTNAFLCNVSHELAIMYNDSAVLESHHSATTFKVTCQAAENKNVNIFQNLEPENFKMIRKSIISMILATDMTQHFEHYNKFLAVNLKCGSSEDGEECMAQVPVSQDNKSLILRMAIKCADISNPSRSVCLARAWAHRIVLEYRDQIAEEKSRALPQSLPPFDDIPKSQVLFVHLFAKDLLTAYYEFLEFGHLTDQLTETFDYWDSFNEENPYPHALTLSISTSSNST
ncbi:high affinity cAMP-specific and IBMX-insensitive 3',5'-cyclic phosphodiesterase 8A-like isoform X3 [Bolinopsis microptera]|uniref:high affinity cAMP-specific and IBMX-insensitive 3',5'-cyclic phosphodiesterase 8A-like isoform X3 n=1 Tax=Bolinopsis microptera TaxID=2820187 RepID=UPI00307AEFC0